MDIEIQPVPLEDKSILQNLMELYQHDFSEYDGADVDEHGCFGYLYLDHYWTEHGRYPFLIRFQGHLAGFVLVRRISPPDADPMHSIAEFFIMRKYRRRGIGRIVAHQVFDMFPGTWSVAQEEENLPAQRFWRSIIAEYTNGDYSEVTLPPDEWKGPVQRFKSRCE